MCYRILIILLLPLYSVVNRAGGRLLVTDMRRGETVFELDPLLQVIIVVLCTRLAD